LQVFFSDIYIFLRDQGRALPKSLPAHDLDHPIRHEW